MSSRPSEIVVIGAGIVGCAVACELARRGASVQIVDQRTVGMGATQASAGVLAPYIEADDSNAAFLDLTIRSLRLYDEFVARVTAETGVAIGYHRTGTLEVAMTDERMTGLRRTAARLQAQGVPLEIFDGAGARAEEPHLTRDVVGAVLVPSHGFVVAGELTRGLVAAARRHGADLVEGSRVRRIVSEDGELVVETDRGSLAGNAVVLAAGSWSGQIDVAGVTAIVPVRPVRGQLLHVGWAGPTLRRVVWSDRCYLVPWDDGTLLV